MIGAVVLAVALQASAAKGEAFVPDAAQEKAAVSWIEQSGHPLPGADAGADALKPMTEALRGARVIGIGEVTHGDHEDQTLKGHLIQELIREGMINTVVIEGNRDAIRGFDTYITTGQGDPVALMRSPSFFRVTRDEEFASLLVWLRAWNQVAATPVHIIGIDDQDAGRDAAFALAMVARHDPAMAKTYREPFGEMIPATGSDFPWAAGFVMKQTTAHIARMKANARALADAIAAHAKDWGNDPDYSEARYAAETAWQCFDIFERNGSDAPADQVLDSAYYTRRDRYMAQNLLARLPSEASAVIWAHNTHVMSSLPDGYVKDGATVLGRELSLKLGNGYRSVGFTYSQGAINVVAGPADKINSRMPETVTPVVNDRPGELGSVFGRVKADALWIDTHSRPQTLDNWLAAEYWFGDTGWGMDPAHWQTDPRDDASHVVRFDQVFDLFVWFRTITPARRFPDKAPPY